MSVIIEEGDRDLYAQVSAHFPDELHRTEKRGGAELIYLEGESIISKLNEVFVYGWGFEIIDQGFNEKEDEVWVRGVITVWRKVTKRTVTVVEGGATTTTYADEIIAIRRGQMGGQKVKRMRSSGKALNLGFEYKAAATDCLKKCASLFGVGLYLWNKTETAELKAILQELEQDQRGAQRPTSNEGAQGDGQSQGREFKRPNRPNRPQQGSASEPQQEDGETPLIINGLRMPRGFQPPFQLDMSKEDQTACRAEGCDMLLDPNADYTVGNETKKGGYVIKRAKEEAGCVLCVTHTAQWYRAKAARTA
jgi:hypothetical protein